VAKARARADALPEGSKETRQWVHGREGGRGRAGGAGRDKSPEEPSEVEVVVERRVVRQTQRFATASAISTRTAVLTQATKMTKAHGLQSDGACSQSNPEWLERLSASRPRSVALDDRAASHLQLHKTRLVQHTPETSTHDHSLQQMTAIPVAHVPLGILPLQLQVRCQLLQQGIMNGGLQNGSLKRSTIGDETIFHLQFSLKDLHDLLALQVPSHVSGDRSGVRTPVWSTGSRRPTNQIKTKAPVRRRGGGGTLCIHA
jgi:hypothetical protein